jgi:hypothetical protein
MRNTIRKVTMLLIVFMISCHVSEKPKAGPVISHRNVMPAAITNAHELPVQTVVRWASCSRLFERDRRDSGIKHWLPRTVGSAATHEPLGAIGMPNAQSNRVWNRH